MPKPETKFWHELKRITPQIKWTRLENSSVFGTPDLLGYNTNHHFFTVELKVTRINSVRLSPHQIAFHKLHPKNSFILVKSLAASRSKLYEGSQIMELDACGLKLEACSRSCPSMLCSRGIYYFEVLPGRCCLLCLQCWSTASLSPVVGLSYVN